MAVTQALLDQLMQLDEEERFDVAELLLSNFDNGNSLPDDERERLHASLERSLEDIKHGRLTEATDVLAELRVRRRP